MWATADDLRRELRSTPQEITDTEAEEWLRTAYLKIQAEIGRNDIIDYFKVKTDRNGNIVRKFKLFFKPVIEVAEVYLNEAKLDPSEYSVDLDKGIITIDSGIELYANDEVYVFYSPEILKLWELKLAAFYLLQALAINTGSGTTDVKLERYVEEINSIEKVVMSKPKVASYREHKTPRVGTWNWGARDRL